MRQAWRSYARPDARNRVGHLHALRRVGGEPFRWLKTQSPQLPPNHGTRNCIEWE